MKCTARQRVGKKKLRMTTRAREDKFSLMNKKTKMKMIKRAQHNMSK